MNFYQRFLGDYMRDTMHLSLAEHGAYSLLLDTYYATEKPLPTDYDSLYRICRAMTKAEQEAVRKVADQFFQTSDDGLRHNKRADQEIYQTQPRIKAAKENGKRGGRPRNLDVTHKEPNGFWVDNQGGSQQEPDGKAHHNHHHIHNQPPEPSPVSGGQATPAGSLAFSSYASAYRQRYHEPPVRNAKVNSLFAQLVNRLGADESPAVAAFYVTHNNVMYVRSGHAADLLLRDAEKLRTEWATGRTVTDTAARQADRKQNNLSVAETLIAEERAKNGH